MAIKPQAKGDEARLLPGHCPPDGGGPTIAFDNNTRPTSRCIAGLGEQHLDVTGLQTQKSKFGVRRHPGAPRVPYRETIRKKVKVQGKHKKQSGGHGQYGDVWIEFEPCDGEELLFEENVFGGAVPSNFFPAVEKGLQDCVKHGILAGYPVVGLKAVAGGRLLPSGRLLGNGL